MSDIRVGCKRDARKALKGELQPVMRRDMWSGEMVPARGASRAAFLSPDRRVTYKVCHSADWDGDNREEAEAVAMARRSDTGRTYVMPTTMWVIDGIAVNAQPTLASLGQEFVKACHEANGGCKPDCTACRAEDEVQFAADELGVGDMHPRNWGVLPDGSPVIIDANITY